MFVFLAQAKYSYFSVDLRLKIFLYHSYIEACQLLFRFSMCLLEYQCTVHRTVISLEYLAFVSAVFFLVYLLVFRFGERNNIIS